MSRKLSGQITVEISIILPIVMLVITSLIFISLYIHDVIAIKSFAYSAGIENSNKNFKNFDKCVDDKMHNVSVFLLKPEVICKNKSGYFEIVINAYERRQVKMAELFTNKLKYNQTIKIEKKMSKEILYAYRAISDNW